MTPTQVKKAREKLGYTQDEISTKLGVSVRYWRDIEIQKEGNAPEIAKYALKGLLAEKAERHKAMKKRAELRTKKSV